jgi:hypothetical protein
MIGEGGGVEKDDHQDHGLTCHSGRRARQLRSIISTIHSLGSKYAMGQSLWPDAVAVYCCWVCQTDLGDLTRACLSRKVLCWCLFWTGILPALRPVPPVSCGIALTMQQCHHCLCLQGHLGGEHHAVILQDAQLDRNAACNNGRIPWKGSVSKVWHDNHPGPCPP